MWRHSIAEIFPDDGEMIWSFSANRGIYSASMILSQYFDRCQGDLTPTQQKTPTTLRRDRGFVLGGLWKKADPVIPECSSQNE